MRILPSPYCMQVKDYYSILELKPSASIHEVKKAYRRMAHLWHPDKKGNDPYAAAQFALVKEAYETLTDPTRKNEYLQERWYAKSTGRMTAKHAETPENLLKDLIQLERRLAGQDQFRMDPVAVYDQLITRFSGDMIGMLNRFGDLDMNATIAEIAARIMRPLPLQHQLDLGSRMAAIQMTRVGQEQLGQRLQEARSSARWERAKIWLLLLAVAAISVLIFWAGS